MTCKLTEPTPNPCTEEPLCKFREDPSAWVCHLRLWGRDVGVRENQPQQRISICRSYLNFYSSCNNSKADHCIFFGALRNLNEFWHAKMFQSSKISGFIQSWLLLIWVSATGSQQNFWMLFMLSVFALRFLSVSLLNLDYDLDSVLCCLPRNFVLVCKYLFWR